MSQVTLRCPLDIGSINVQWQKDKFGLGFDPELPSYPRYRYLQSEEGCHLIIEKVIMRDNDLYTCTAVYPGKGMTVVRSVELVVMVGVSQPVILQDNPLTMLEGQTITLKCISQGKPAPEVSYHLLRPPLTS